MRPFITIPTIVGPAPRLALKSRLARFATRARADLLLVVLDVIFVSLAMAWALVLRFDGHVPDNYWDGYRQVLPYCLIAVVVANVVCGLYGQVWRHASVQEARRVLGSTVIFGLALLAVDTVERRAVPLSVLLVTILLQIVLSGGVRFYSRLFSFHRYARHEVSSRVVVLGAGEAAAALVRDMVRSARWSSRPLLPVAMLDDNRRLHGHACLGVPVLGSIDRLPEIVAMTNADQAVLAIPSARQEQVRRIADLARKAGTTLRVLPGVAELVNQRISVNNLRALRIDDLVGRQQVSTDMGAVRALLSGRRVLVTGAGGSIGSEIVRQVAECEPAQILALDHDETHLHELCASLEAPIVQLLADVRDQRVISDIFDRTRPDVVFHAAAHKHVPVLENYPCEAARTNVLGTDNVVAAAEASGVGWLVYVSTDKAVKPSSVMGASKRIGEQLTLRRAGGDGRFCVVRFGNVLGSRGSVIPTFMKQIEAGGPVTVTDERMTRFFMSIPEAVQLVLQAAAFARGGEVFMLDMGEPVRIVDLARRMIELSERRDGPDIRIEVVGIRPGEKLAEELRTPEEEVSSTAHPSIVSLQPRMLSEELVADGLNRLREAVAGSDEMAARALLFGLVDALATEATSFSEFVPMSRPAPLGRHHAIRTPHDLIDTTSDHTEESRAWTPSVS